MGDNPVVKKWWDHMADIMEVNEDNFSGYHSLEEGFIWSSVGWLCPKDYEQVPCYLCARFC